jgi:hypothetical protein
VRDAAGHGAQRLPYPARQAARCVVNDAPDQFINGNPGDRCHQRDDDIEAEPDWITGLATAAQPLAYRVRGELAQAIDNEQLRWRGFGDYVPDDVPDRDLACPSAGRTDRLCHSSLPWFLPLPPAATPFVAQCSQKNP